MRDKLRNSRWLKWGLLFLALYTFLPLFFYPQYYFAGRSVSWFIRLFVQSYTWMILTPFILWFGHHFPVEYPRRLKNLIILCLSPFFFAAVHTILFILIWHVGVWGETVDPRMIGFYLNIFTGGTIFCAGILTFQQAINYSRKYREREFRLQQAQLQALKIQLNPHFLFNTLNAISEFVYSSPQVADKTISHLSDLLRLSFKSGNTQEVTLKEELDFLRKYVQIQQTLLDERLKVRWDIDAGTLDAFVPNMILQPLIENSIIHGIARKESGGVIEIGAERRNGTLYLRVSDNGEYFTTDETALNGGIGLTNVKARLRHLYGPAQEFKIGKSPTGGETLVRIAIPFHEQAVEEKDEYSNDYN